MRYQMAFTWPTGEATGRPWRGYIPINAGFPTPSFLCVSPLSRLANDSRMKREEGRSCRKCSQLRDAVRPRRESMTIGSGWRYPRVANRRNVC